MRTATCSMVVWLALAGAARADAIMPFEGDCPPGLRVRVVSHSEACVPEACATDADCGRGAACRDVHECFAPREFWGEGRVRIDPPVMRDTVIGECRADRSCEEGACRSRRQCEPTSSTPAWDPRARRWTGEPHRSSSCSVGHGGALPGWLSVVAFGNLLLVLRRRRT